ncbi:MAG: Gfo/Idh/MocA family oxidoreductase [Gemmatimonadetes bacterium]|nr:Gfo/Idh/MocA family oxidoreductase [Gemmatimonadota bacterium]MBT7862363.1 Gfo/Idh/MocA family oxidoreductase [Gemmatimonadota bacterium]
MATPVRVGIVGLGQRALQHLNCLWRIPEAQIVALCDPFPENLEESKIQDYVEGFQLGDIRIHTKFADMLEGGGLDAVYFCIPPNRHDGEVIASAAAGLAIFAEKPVSLYYDEAVEMETAIQEAGVIASVGFNQRHVPNHEAVRDFVQDKRLVMATTVGNGSLESHSVKHTRTEDLDGPGNRIWAASIAWSGTTVVEAGIHQLDMMRYWAGDVAWVRADYVHRHADDIEDGGDNPDAYSVTYGFECGLVYNMLLSRLRKTFYGDGYSDLMWDRGHVKIEADGPVAYYYEGPYPPEKNPSQDELRHVIPVPDPGRDGTLHINECFVKAVATGDDSHLRNTFSSSMNSHAAVLAANLSDQLEGVKIDLSTFATDPAYAAFRAKPTS